MSLLLIVLVICLILIACGGFSGYGPTPAWLFLTVIVVVLLVLFGLPGEIASAASWGTGLDPDASWGT